MSLSLDFYSKENMKLIMEIFDNYMKDKHNIVIETFETSKNHKKFVYECMNKVYQQDKPAQELNVLVLTILREHYLRLSKSMQGQKPNVATLQRDTRVFGDRQVNYNEIIPEFSRPEDTVNTKNLERLILEREQQKPNEIKTPDISKLGKQIIETPEDTNNFMMRLNNLEKERNMGEHELVKDNLDKDFVMDRLIIDSQTQVANNIANHDPKAFFTADIKPFQNEQNNNDDAPFMSSSTFLNPRSDKVKCITKYLSINSIDRNYELEPLRYKFSVNSFSDNNDFQKRYRNIQSISVSRIVIPEEILQVSSITNQNVKQSFVHDFSFAYPYIMLTIDEFNDIYDGTNDAVRKAFCKLIYDCSYKAPNGRGYIILKPMQKEKKTFYPSPLSSFGKLSLNLLRPNGELLNQSADNYKLLKVEYEAANSLYLKIVTYLYFDKNEFWLGDDIIIKNHQMTALTDTMTPENIKKFNDFINKKEGHEIKQIGNPNDYGYFKTFYIQAPGSFDKVQGRFVVDNNLITTLNTYNTQIDFCDPACPTNGSILNTSLQNTISMEIDMLVDDARIIERDIL